MIYTCLRDSQLSSYSQPLALILERFLKKFIDQQSEKLKDLNQTISVEDQGGFVDPCISNELLAALKELTEMTLLDQDKLSYLQQASCLIDSTQIVK